MQIGSGETKESLEIVLTKFIWMPENIVEHVAEASTKSWSREKCFQGFRRTFLANL